MSRFIARFCLDSRHKMKVRRIYANNLALSLFAPFFPGLPPAVPRMNRLNSEIICSLGLKQGNRDRPSLQILCTSLEGPSPPIGRNEIAQKMISESSGLALGLSSHRTACRLVPATETRPAYSAFDSARTASCSSSRYDIT
jgi:hypothetical protein